MKRFFTLGGAFLLTVFVLTGCGASDQFRSWFRDQLLERSGIKTDENYIKAEQNREAGLLDEHGYLVVRPGAEDTAGDSATEVIAGNPSATGTGNSATQGKLNDPAEDSTPASSGTIHVTFAENTNLRITYFLDEAHKTQIEGRDIYLNPGDAVYYENTAAQSQISDQYYFAGFRCYEYGADGTRTELQLKTDATQPPAQATAQTAGSSQTITQALDLTRGTLRIPADFTGNELSIEPVGKYVPRLISLQAYWVDASGRENTIRDCTWRINDEVYDAAQTVIKPHISYTVSLEYDPAEYYFVAGEGDIFSRNEDIGRIQFRNVNATSGVANFRVELHPYTTLSISGGSRAIRSVNVVRENESADQTDNGGSDAGATGQSGNDASDAGTNGQAGSITKVSDPELITNLKPGDIVCITLDSDYKLMCSTGSAAAEFITCNLAPGLQAAFTATDEGDLYEIRVGENDRGTIALEAAKWADKTISVQIDENGFWEKIRNNYLSWVPFLDKAQEQDFLVITAGEERCTYSDLRNGKTLKMSEKDQLTIKVDETRIDGFTVKIAIDGGEPVTVGADSREFSFTYTFDEVSQIAIELEEG